MKDEAKGPEERKKLALRRATNVLVIKFGSRAAFVQSLAAAQAIHEFHVGARITLLTFEAHQTLAEKCPYFDRVEADGKPREPRAAAQLVARIRAAKYDMVYDLQCTPRTNNYYLALRPWPPNWSGAAPGASHPYDDSGRASLHPIDRDFAQLRAAGVEVEGEAPAPDLSWIRQALRDPPRLQPGYFSLRQPYLIMAPRGSADAPERCWGAANYVDLARRAAARGVMPVVVGEGAERDIATAIAKAEPRVKNLVARPDPFQSATLAARAAFVVGDDAALLHVAAAAGAPCLALLSSSAPPALTIPRGKGGVVVMTAPVVADLPVEQVDRALRNCGAYLAATA